MLRCGSRLDACERDLRLAWRPSLSENHTMEQLANPEIWIALATLTALELVLGIDNIIFISILAGKLPPAQRDRARKAGILLAAVTRLALLMAIAWIVGLTAPLFSVFGHPFSWRDLILIGGGLFLIAKATHEIHQKVEGAGLPPSVASAAGAAGTATFGAVIGQIMLLDIVFSLDSIITAVGMVDQRWVMVTAILASIVFMLAFARPIGEFVERHPTVKVLALSFLIMIGLVLVADGFGQHIPKGYIYAAMAFSVFVEMINLWIRRRAERAVAPVKRRGKAAGDGGAVGWGGRPPALAGVASAASPSHLMQGQAVASRAACASHRIAPAYGPGPWLMRATPSSARRARGGVAGMTMMLTGKGEASATRAISASDTRPGTNSPLAPASA